MIEKESAISVQEVSMREWAMVAFHAERAPRRVQVMVSTAVVDDDGAVGYSRSGFWFLLAAGVTGLGWWLM